MTASPGSPGAILEVERLSKRFGELNVFDGIDLRVSERGVHTIIGPNGAGKTTLFNCITGVHHPDAGSVRLRGDDVTSAPVVKRVRMGLVRTFQISRVFDGLSVAENVRLPLLKQHLGGGPGLFVSRRERRRIDARCRDLLDEVEIPAGVHRLPAQSLSYGDRRTLEVAMALACDPVVLCLDEPTAGLGIGESESLAALIKRLGERLAVLLVEHRMSIVHDVSDNVTVLALGQIVVQGSPDAVAADERVQDVYLGRQGRGREEVVTSLRVRVSAPTAEHEAAGQTAASPGLTLDAVDSYYGDSHVLHSVSLVAEPGRVTSVLGRNGAGKTTTLATIMGLVRARSGSIRLGERELARMPTHRIAELGVALIPERRWIFPDLTVEENIQISGGTTPELLDEAYGEFPALYERRQAKGSQLSGGQQQMLAFARAIVRHPGVILLDEPTQGLSPIYVEMIVHHVQRLRERGVTVVLVEQVLDVVTAVSDTVYLLSDGRVEAQLQPGELHASNELLARHLHIQHR